MRRLGVFVCAGAIAACGLTSAQANRADETELWRHRNLGKAFYENPTTQAQAVDEFRKALALAPNSLREQINYGLALIRAGDTKSGMAALQKAQKVDPKLPQTWFNLGVAFKRQGDLDAALAQFRGMERLVPDEPATHHQIGFILKTKGELNAAVKEFETARNLNPRLGAPHFQLFGLYRQLNRTSDAAVELRAFQEIKKQQEGAAILLKMWSGASIRKFTILRPLLPRPFRLRSIAPTDGRPGSPESPAIRMDSKARPSLIAWSTSRVVLFQDGRTPVNGSGLENLHGVVSIAPGDFGNDGLSDLCVITTSGGFLTDGRAIFYCWSTDGPKTRMRTRPFRRAFFPCRFTP